MAKIEYDSYSFRPIGFIRTPARYRYEEPRQAAFDATPARIEFVPDARMKEALADLEGFDRLWVIAVFHLNLNPDRSANWNPKVRPPVAPDGRRYGVFSTRSPHRPNPIALSCVEVDRIDGAVIHLKACDLLDGTPVLDVKPYIPAVDAFPGAAAGWRDRADAEAWRISFSPEAMARIVFLRDSGAPDLESFCRIQLGINPFDAGRKRVEVRGDGVCAIGCRTWRILFTADGAVRGIRVETVISHYRADELTPGAEDRYGDKELHRAFLAAFPPEGSGS